MSALAQNAETQELSEALEKLRQEADRIQTVIDTAGCNDMRSAFIALTGSGREDAE